MPGGRPAALRRPVALLGTAIALLAAALSATPAHAAPPASAAGTARAASAAAPLAHGAAARSETYGAPARSRRAKVVYLTFDDGPGPYTSKVLKTLSRYGARATFFEIGQNVVRHPGLTRKVIAQGGSVQNHTWSHPDLTRVSASVFRSQVIRTDHAIHAAIGRTPKCLRPPYGAVDHSVYARARALHKKVVLWTVDPQDWARPGTSAIVHRVLTHVRPGSVVIMHDGGGNRSQTVAALPKILKTLKKRGYTFQLIACG
ncbi:polysaccharide deacetylase family protein [Actinoallomurus purpureus]|uniref:polysaccharide deacetylase family protein n=1 Tax=Actinoallomurus purpureus TaxID=478114 RepID=UPI002091FBBB|nr:polysaccharide deacetylase family protein [Actinoallomurus purpureus]MCO6008968.1 polysaccharide deacetylase family protein [Actinoallomurus purpureus]